MTNLTKTKLDEIYKYTDEIEKQCLKMMSKRAPIILHEVDKIRQAIYTLREINYDPNMETTKSGSS